MRAALLVGLLLLGACGSTGTAPPSAEERTEQSVRPGINDPFLGDDLDVAKFAGNWEGESREVYFHRAEIVARLGLEPGDAVADVGSGTGAFLAELARAVGPNGTVYSLDIAPDFVEHCRARAVREGLATVDARLCSEDSIDLPANSIDAAFLCDVYHHFEYPRSSMGSIAKALRPGGEVVIVDFERIEGVSRPWILGHVRAGKEVVLAELDSFGFELVEEIRLDGLKENWMARFRVR